jgi:hypothetical protein
LRRFVGQAPVEAAGDAAGDVTGEADGEGLDGEGLDGTGDGETSAGGDALGATEGDADGAAAELHAATVMKRMRTTGKERSGDPAFMAAVRRMAPTPRY